MLSALGDKERLFRLDAARYRLVFDVVAPITLEGYAGSALRGVFGHALIALCGLSHADIATKSEAYLRSPYAFIFNAEYTASSSTLNNVSTAPSAYVIEAPLGNKKRWEQGEQFSFDIVILGQALKCLELIFLAWRRGLLRGLGPSQGTAQFVRADSLDPAANARTVYSMDAPKVVAHARVLEAPLAEKSEDVEIRLLSPMRLQHRGRILTPDQVTGSLFLRNLVRRTTMQLQMQGHTNLGLAEIQKMNIQADETSASSCLTWQEWGRYSSRQQKKMALGGLMGTWQFYAMPPALLTMLYFGQWLHIGKETAFGLGRYQYAVI
jgi:hypothetical protein